MAYKLTTVIERDEDGYFVYVPELPGCMSQGDTLDEAVANIREATEGYLSVMSPEARAELRMKELLVSSVVIEDASLT